MKMTDPWIINRELIIINLLRIDNWADKNYVSIICFIAHKINNKSSLCVSHKTNVFKVRPPPEIIRNWWFMSHLKEKNISRDYFCVQNVDITNSSPVKNRKCWIYCIFWRITYYIEILLSENAYYLNWAINQWYRINHCGEPGLES